MEHDSELSGRMQGTMLLASSNSSGGDPLTTHPLLSPAPSTTDIHQSPPTSTVPSPPRYVPYTPRQRPIGSATTSTTLSSSIAVTGSPSSPIHSHGGAAGKLQLQSLKASVQTMGLDNNSVGWAIIEKLVSGDVEGPDWDAIWQIVSTSQVTLLLPTEKASAGLIVTPEFVRDHVAFCNAPIKESTSLVTLGGLRGVIDERSITFRTAFSTTSETFLAIQRTSSRSTTLASLAPLSTGCDPNTPYPTYQISDHQASLHIPPRPVPTQPPPLPPRPAAPVATAATSSGGTLSGRFASLFGSSRATTPVPVPAPALAAPASATSSPIANKTLSLPPRPNSPQPPASIRSEASVESTQSGNPYAADGHFVTAFAIDHKIVRKDVSKGVTKALKADVKIRLGGGFGGSTSAIPPLPHWITERILSFTAPLQPLAKKSSKLDVNAVPGTSPSSPLTPKNFPSSSPGSTSNLVVDLSNAQDMAFSFQDFYDDVEDELRKDKSWSAQTPRSRSVDEGKGEKDGPTTSAAHNGEDPLDEAVREAMDLVEGCITSIFYDQLFIPQVSDDASHDEALANRIAALNMLDLGWEHLGVEMDASASQTTKGIDDVVSACGRELQKLQDVAYRSPQAKAALLVAVHRVIVDGLSHLPPVRLKPDGEQIEHHGSVSSPNLDTKTPRQESFGGNMKHHQQHDTPISPLHSHFDSPLHTESPQGLLTPDSGSSALPQVKSLSLLGSPRVQQSSLRSLSPGPSINSSPRPMSLSLALPESDTTTSAPVSSEQERPEHRTPSGGAGKTAVNTDVLLPIIIFSVVKANPVQLVSQLLFIQRYRSRHVGGEESFCLINFLAVVEFLEHVDMQALGLGDADRVMSTQDLTPLPLSTSNGPTSPISASASARLRGRVEQQVGELATGATKVISGVGGVVDSSFSALRGLLNVIPDPAANDEGRNTNSPAAVVSAMITRPGFGLLRRGTSFSIAGVAASLPGGGSSSSAPSREKKGGLEQGQQMVEVPSRPGSIRRFPVDDDDDDDASNGSPDDSSDGGDDSTSDNDDYTAGEAEQDDDHREGSIFRDKSDTRSIRSFSSMMSRDREDDREREKDKRDRPSLTDRLANMPALSRFSGNPSTGTPPGSRRTSLLPPPRQDGGSPLHVERIAPPIQHFLQTSADELRISEVSALLADYKRVVEALRGMGGFQE